MGGDSPRKPDPADAHIDYGSLAEFLKALSFPTRLEILDALRVPRMIGEIRVSPQRVPQGENADRAVARQTIQAHLDRLVASDLVRDEPVEVGERLMRRYAVNSQKLYAVTEELRRLTTRYAGRGAEEQSTASLSADGPPSDRRATGPRLVLVHGMYEGKVYRLDPALATPAGWLVGRKRGLAISLDYDPFVSGENSLVTAHANGHAIADLASSRNGTRVNWEQVAPGERRVLASGDVVGVGRSLLVYVPK